MIACFDGIRQCQLCHRRQVVTIALSSFFQVPPTIMSRLPSSLFHCDFPLSIPSPPDSHSDTVTANLQDVGLQTNHGLANTNPESAGTRLRKPLSTPYHSSSLRDNNNKEKGQRFGKPLIIVIPPPTLVYDHGHVTHTLSNGPFHRLSEGVAMPLFPSVRTVLLFRENST